MIDKNSCSIEVVGIGRRSYINSTKGRADLLHDLAGDSLLLTSVLDIWGDVPTVQDTPEPPEPTLNELKAQKKAEIAAARYAAETSGCTVEGVPVATDRGSQALLTAAVVMARLDIEFKTRWKCADGRFVTLDAMQLRAIGDAVIAHVEACFAREGELCEQIDAAQTPEELDAIQWSL